MDRGAQWYLCSLYAKIPDDQELNVMHLLEALCGTKPGEGRILNFHEKVYKTEGFKDSSSGILLAQREISDAELMSSSAAISSTVLSSSKAPSLSSLARLPSPMLPEKTLQDDQDLSWTIHYMREVPVKDKQEANTLVRSVVDIPVTPMFLNPSFMRSVLSYTLDYEYLLKGFGFKDDKTGVEARVYSMNIIKQDGDLSSRQRLFEWWALELRIKASDDERMTAESKLWLFAGHLQPLVRGFRGKLIQT